MYTRMIKRYIIALPILVIGALSAQAELVGYWNMDENGGGIVADQQSGNDGTLQNGATFSTPGKFNSTEASTSALNLATTGDYAYIGNVAELKFDRTDAFSISAWIKTDGTGGNATIFSKMSKATPYPGYSFHINSANKLGVNVVNDWTTSAISVVGATDVTDGSWHHVVMTYDGSSSASGVSLYLDGTAEALNVDKDNLTTGSIDSNVAAAIGARHNTTALYEGLIDEVAVWNEELSASYVNTVYTQGIPEPATLGLFIISSGMIIAGRRLLH